MSNDPEEIEGLKYRCSDMGTALTDAIHRLAAVEAERDALREAVHQAEVCFRAIAGLSQWIDSTMGNEQIADAWLAKHGGSDG